MRYKVGDKVRIRSDLQISRRYGSYMFASGMDHYKGSVVTISKEQQSLYFYCIEEDEGSWIWAEEMFEGLDTSNSEENIKAKEMAVAAMKKQIPKRPVTYASTNRADCPVCGETVRGIDNPYGKYCSRCGQRLDWSDYYDKRR